jgi:hypothetical protein
MESATRAYFDEASRAFATDAHTALAIAMLEHADEGRDSARHQRLLEEQHQQLLEHAQVEAMRDEADQIRAAGQARGVAGIVGGGLQAAGGFVQLSAVGSEQNAAPTTTAQGWGTALGGAGQVSSSVGELVGSRHDGQAADHSADQTAFAHRVEASERRRQALSDQANEALELRRNALQHLENISESEANAAQAVVFRGIG